MSEEKVWKEVKKVGEMTIVCKIREGSEMVECDIYKGGEYVESKRIPRSKLKEIEVII